MKPSVRNGNPLVKNNARMANYWFTDLYRECFILPVSSTVLRCSGGSAAAKDHFHHLLKNGEDAEETVIVGESQLIKVNCNSIKSEIRF